MPSKKSTAPAPKAAPPKSDAEQPMDPMPPRPGTPLQQNAKSIALEPFRADPRGQLMVSDHGLPIENTDDSLKAGSRGPTLLEDFHLREKMTRFDHERIPERVVHARGSGAHGVFQVYESLANFTEAAFLCDPAVETPVFVRFSTVQGSRGSADTVRDVRGFAAKFYTTQGNFDLVGNNMPVFFIQDGIKFPDVVHAVKPEPGNEIPQGSSAHDSFWDFISLVPESAHMVMWLLSDRAIPRSYRMMEGFGVHTFRLVNAQGVSSLVKFHWKPLLGAHSLVWDEAQKLAGKDPDFHRRDLWNAIETGAFPEYELCLQIMTEDQELAFGFDLLDPTKLVPEELVPVRRVGKLTLNRNPQNFFAETEQIAFHLGNVVPGIDFTNDPLLQARLFSYVDTQLTRLGGPNFAEIPINRPIVPVHNHQQDGFHRDTINTGAANYHPNSLGGGCPFLADPGKGFRHHQERVEGHKIRERSASFGDHFSQAKLFLDSQSPPERKHLVEAARFEIGKVQRKAIRQRVLGIFREIDPVFAEEVAAGVGVAVPAGPLELQRGTAVPTFRGENGGITMSPALSLEAQPKTSILSRKVAVLLGPGYAAADVTALRSALAQRGAIAEMIGATLGLAAGDDGSEVEIDKTFQIAASVFYDGIFVPGGAASFESLKLSGDAIHFVNEAYKHCKTIGASGEGVDLLADGDLVGSTLSDAGLLVDKGVVTSRASDPDALAEAFVAALALHRHWERGSGKRVPA